jgi:hypothetical protein
MSRESPGGTVALSTAGCGRGRSPESALEVDEAGYGPMSSAGCRWWPRRLSDGTSGPPPFDMKGTVIYPKIHQLTYGNILSEHFL